MKLTLEVHDSVVQHLLDMAREVRAGDPTPENVALLLKDALSEFVSRRSPAKVYVDRRYGFEETSSAQTRKVAEVQARCALAEAIRATTANVEVEVG